MPLQSTATLRQPSRPPYTVNIYDLSMSGCKVEFVERPQLDDHVWVKFAGLEALEAMVCWVKGHVAGLEFSNPIHPAVFDHLLLRLGPH